MASRPTRHWANSVEMCVLGGQSSFTSAQHISMWEVKENSPPFWMRRSYRKRSIYSLSIRFNIFIFVLYCKCGMILFMCISFCHSVCLHWVSAREKKIGRASHAVCPRVCLCLCVSGSVWMCDMSAFLLGYFPGWLIWFDIGGFVLCEQSAWGG